MNAPYPQDTIAAVATAPGRGGVAIVRVSGKEVNAIAKALIPTTLVPRYATTTPFLDGKRDVLDTGVAIYFKGPHSYTGEDVLELQGHGGPAITDLILNTVLSLGARMALPGEFTERAFLNDKIDLAQAEAVADLIDASTSDAAMSASRSLQGVFSEKIQDLSGKIIKLRTFVEAAIDFSEEEIDELSNNSLSRDLNSIIDTLEGVRQSARQGQLLKEGLQVAIVGQPNAGKSSLMNALTEDDTAIVTPFAGTTRDLIKATIQVDGIPFHLTDTAGIRDNAEVIEQQGIERAHKTLKTADKILLVVDASTHHHFNEMEKNILSTYGDKVLVVMNKIDLIACPPSIEYDSLTISAINKKGIASLLSTLKTATGKKGEEGSCFSARRRHVNALEKAREYLEGAKTQLLTFNALECVAEELKCAHDKLGEIVGKMSSDALLGEIFGDFCIGK